MMDGEKITVLVVEPEKKPYVKEIGADLAAMQAEVGGYIQAAYPYEEPVALVMDEEAKLTGKPFNRALRDEDGDIYDIVAGKFFVVGLGESDFISLDQKYIEKFSELFKTPEMFMRLNGKLLVLPVPEEEKPSIGKQLRETKPTVSHGAKKKEHGKEER